MTAAVPIGAVARYRAAALAAFGLLFAGTATAQAPWRSSYFPYPIGNPGDGAMLMVRWQRTQNAPYFISKTDEEDVINPITFAGAVSAEAGLGTLGSRVARVEFRGPGLVDGWRFRALAAAERTGRFAYYGLGGDIERTDHAGAPTTGGQWAGTDDANDNGYRVHRSRYLLHADVTRRVAGNLRLALGALFDRTEFSPLPETSLFRDQWGGSVARTNFVLRPAVVFDSRDREYTPGNGLLLEAGVGVGTGGNDSGGGNAGYGFGYLNLRGYVSPREGTVLAVRGLYRSLSDKAPLSARFTVPGWERETALSGAEGHRSFPLGALGAVRATLVGVEVRHDLLNAGDLGAITLMAFGDYGRFEDPAASFRFRTEQYGGGGGIAIRVLRSAHLTANFAGGSNGLNFSMGTAWTF
ncbi:MAG: hypothetical protein AB7L66_00480 [Gemmatimonadales bacterium]